MHGFDPNRLGKLAESLAIAFYALMFLAFVTTVFGSPGTGLLLLILGACAHVGRVWFEDLSRAARPGRPSRPARSLDRST